MSVPPESDERPLASTTAEGPAHPEDVPSEERRKFLKVGVGVLGAGCACAVAVPAVGYLAFPLGHDVTSKLDAYLPAGEAEAFGDTPTKVDLYADRVDAWNRVRQVKVGSAWVAKRDGKWLALSTVCPHLGCAIDWDGEAKLYTCPCHTSAFEPSGAHQQGPAPRGMDELEVKEAEGLVQIRYQRFRQGLSGKETV